MLWNSIYEFFIKYVFGGIYGSLDNTSIQYYYGYFSNDGTSGLFATTNTYITLFGVHMPLGNYFSFVATLISIIIIVVLCCLFIAKIVKLFGKLFSGGTL